MNKTAEDIQFVGYDVESLEDRIDILFRELELSTRWQRPSILLAIYSSEYVCTDAKTALKDRLVDMQQFVQHIQVGNDENSDIPLCLSEIADLDKGVFFIEGLRWGGGREGTRAYRALNIGREYFIDQRIRVVFWLTENEANDLARYAPDFWSYRHRVVEFIDPPSSEQISARALESSWQGIGEYADSLEDIDAGIALREAMLRDLPEGDESTANRANLLFSLGILNWRRGDFEKAARFIHTSLDIAGKIQDKWFEAVCHNAVALVKTALGRMDEAVESLKRASSLAPDQTFHWNNLGNLYCQLDRQQEAMAALEKAIELNPSDAVSWNGLGNVYLKLGRCDEAISTYQKAIEFAPNCAYPWVGLGDVFASSERIEEAVAAYQKALEINQRLIHPWISLGNIFEKQRRSQDAIRAYQHAFEIDPNNAQLWNEQGNVYLNAGAYDEAINAYRKAIELEHGFGWPYSNLALTYAHKGKHTEAIPLYQKSIELFRSNRDKASAWNRLGHTYRQMHDDDNAIAAFQRAVELDADNATFKKVLDEIQNDIGHVYEALTTDKEAASAVDQRTVEPVKLNLNQVLYSNDQELRRNGSGYTDESVVTYKRVTEINSQNDYGYAILDYQRAVEFVVLDPHNTSFRIDPNGYHRPLDYLGEADAADQGEASAEAQSDVGLDPGTGFAWIDLGELHYDDHGAEAIATTPEDVNAADQSAGELFPDQVPVGSDPDEIQESTNAVEVVVTTNNEAASVAVIRYTEKSPETVSFQNDPGDKHEDLKKNADAIAAYEKVTEINPKNARAWHTLGNLYRTSGRYPEAAAAFEQAISLDPDKEVFHYHLGLVHAAQKHYTDAIRAFQKVVELNPGYNLAHSTLAGYYRRLGQENEARKHISIALPTMKDETEYNRACFEAICGNADQALVLLGDALEKKQTSVDWVRRDPDFEFIHDDPRFKALVG
ncbi:MAG: tetratricopeptide repeat protein [Anaerolineales bacterium]|nr:tetratricopeptide repeat protein [Anaerolineales bacterium]